MADFLSEDEINALLDIVDDNKDKLEVVQSNITIELEDIKPGVDVNTLMKDLLKVLTQKCGKVIIKGI